MARPLSSSRTARRPVTGASSSSFNAGMVAWRQTSGDFRALVKHHALIEQPEALDDTKMRLTPRLGLRPQRPHLPVKGPSTHWPVLSENDEIALRETFHEQRFLFLCDASGQRHHKGHPDMMTFVADDAQHLPVETVGHLVDRHGGAFQPGGPGTIEDLVRELVDLAGVRYEDGVIGRV